MFTGLCVVHECAVELTCGFDVLEQFLDSLDIGFLTLASAFLFLHEMLNVAIDLLLKHSLGRWHV
jgi:hypothetical protein